nr:MAG TPA: hypothetical protein [Caudoviricetes sp.]
MASQTISVSRLLCAGGRLQPVSEYTQLYHSPPNNRNLITKSLIFFPAVLTIVRALSLAQ